MCLHLFSGKILVYLFSKQNILLKMNPKSILSMNFYLGNNNHSCFQNKESSLIDNITIYGRQTVSDNIMQDYQSLHNHSLSIFFDPQFFWVFLYFLQTKTAFAFILPVLINVFPLFFFWMSYRLSCYNV